MFLFLHVALMYNKHNNLSIVFIILLSNTAKKGNRVTIARIINYLSSHTKNAYCRDVLHNESLNLLCCADVSADNVTLLGAKTNTKSPTFLGFPLRA